MLRYQVNCFLSGEDIVRVLRSDALTLCRVHDCVTNDGMSSPSKQNPFVFCQVLERNVLLFSSYVGLRETYPPVRVGEVAGKGSTMLSQEAGVGVKRT